MTANALIGYVNRIESGVLTAGSAESERPIADLAKVSGGDYWQTTAGTVSTWFQCDAGSAVEWRLFGLFRTNLTTAATVRWMLGTTAGASDVLDTTAAAANIQAGYGQTVQALGQGYSARYLRCEIADAGNPDGFLRVPLAFAGPAWQPGRNFSYGWSIGWEDPTEMDETIGGQEIARLGPPARRVLELAFDLVGESVVHGTLLEIDRLKGRTGNVLAVPRPDQAAAIVNREAVFGRLGDNARPSNPGFQLWAKRYRVRERL